MAGLTVRILKIFGLLWAGWLAVFLLLTAAQSPPTPEDWARARANLAKWRHAPPELWARVLLISAGTATPLVVVATALGVVWEAIWRGMRLIRMLAGRSTERTAGGCAGRAAGPLDGGVQRLHQVAAGGGRAGAGPRMLQAGAGNAAAAAAGMPEGNNQQVPKLVVVAASSTQSKDELLAFGVNQALLSAETLDQLQRTIGQKPRSWGIALRATSKFALTAGALAQGCPMSGLVCALGAGMVPGLAGLQVFEEGEGTHVTIVADVKGFAASKQQLGMDTAMQRTWTVNIAGLLESAYDAAKPWKKASFGMVSSLVADMCVPGFDAGGSAKDCEELGGLLAGYAAFREASAAHGVKLALRTAPDTLLELPSTEDMQHVRQRLGAQQHPHPAPH